MKKYGLETETFIEAMGMQIIKDMGFADESSSPDPFFLYSTRAAIGEDHND